MSLDLGRLEKVRDLGSGILQARCPSCAETGSDKAGEHLRIYPDDRFGCCVHPGDREHRQRIFALAGDKSPRTFTVKVSAARPAPTTATSIAASLAIPARTLRTPISKSQPSEKTASQASQLSDTEPQYVQCTYFRTLRTPSSNPRAYARQEELPIHDYAHIYKDSATGVLSVLSKKEAAKGDQPAEPAPKEVRMPYITPGGDLVIPFDSPERFHYWKPGGQSLKKTLSEITLLEPDPT